MAGPTGCSIQVRLSCVGWPCTNVTVIDRACVSKALYAFDKLILIIHG